MVAKLIISNSPNAIAEVYRFNKLSSNKPTDTGLKIEAKSSLNCLTLMKLLKDYQLLSKKDRLNIRFLCLGLLF